MNAGYRYGLFLSLILLPLIFLIENLVLMAFVWMAFAVQLGIGAWLVWRRVGAGLAAAGMAVASLNSAVFAVFYLKGFDPFALGSQLLLVLPALLVAPLLFWLESRRNPEMWRAWGKFMEDASVRDMLGFRHIPHWRDTTGATAHSIPPPAGEGTSD